MLSFLLLMLLSGCIAQDAKVSRNQSVVVYTDHTGIKDSLIYQRFEKQNKITVYFKVLPTDSILDIIQSEKFNSYADLIILHGADQLKKATELRLFTPITSAYINSIPDKNYTASNKHWFALSKTPIVIAYDKRVLKADTISNYDELLQERWKGKIALQRPDYTTLKVLERSMARMSSKTLNLFMPKLYLQTVLAKEGDDLQQLKRIKDGKAQLALIELAVLEQANNQFKDSTKHSIYNNITVVFPDQSKKGCFYNITGAGIYRYARNPKNAELLLEFLASPKGQYDFAAGRFEFPVNETIKSDYQLDKYGKFRARFVANKKKN